MRTSRVLGAVVTTAALAAGALSAQAQVTPAVPQPITIRVAIGGPLPDGVTGYRVEALCQNVPLSATTILRLGVDLPRTGGTGTVQVPLAVNVSCIFRLTVLGSGPRPLLGNGIFVGGVGRAIVFPTVVDGVSVDAFTVAETDYVPVASPTSVLWGDPATLAASTSTTPPTTTPTTTPTTAATTPSTTTRPPVTTPPTTAPAQTAPPATIAATAPRTTAVRPRFVTRKVCVKVRNRRCVAYRLVRVRA